MIDPFKFWGGGEKQYLQKYGFWEGRVYMCSHIGPDNAVTEGKQELMGRGEVGNLIYALAIFLCWCIFDEETLEWSHML